MGNSTTLSFDLELTDGWRDGLETVKAWLSDSGDVGITHASSLEDVFCVCATVGVGVIHEQMKAGEWERYASEVELGNQVDSILRDDN